MPFSAWVGVIQLRQFDRLIRTQNWGQGSQGQSLYQSSKPVSGPGAGPARGGDKENRTESRQGQTHPLPGPSMPLQPSLPSVRVSLSTLLGKQKPNWKVSWHKACSPQFQGRKCSSSSQSSAPPLLLHPRCPFTFSGTCLVILPWFLSSESSTLSLFTRLLPSAVMLIHW